MDLKKRFARLGISLPEILLPGPSVSLPRWAVIACDQFTSEKSYWEETRRLAGEAPSALNLIIPECYLEEEDLLQRVEQVNRSMKDYLEQGLFTTLSPGLLYLERSTPRADSRQGLVFAVDLEAYDFSPDSSRLIRPTEGTIRDRIPPRMAIRRGASLDLPHILLLMDDPQNTVMKAALSSRKEAPVYDFDLMQGGGRITGWHLSENLERTASALEDLASRRDLLFAVGDGNHSLASAKEIWLEKKAAGAPPDHPARFALVELENIHDPALLFHPIHRLIFGVDPAALAEEMRSALGAGVSPCTQPLGETDLASPPPGKGQAGVIFPGREEIWEFPLPPGGLAADFIQKVLDKILPAAAPEARIDYIHGGDTLKDLAGPGRLGILLPPVDKESFFDRIGTAGAYPRKTFSIGEAVEKRYYLEARRLAL